MEDPVLFEFVTPRIFGEFALQIVDPVRFVIGYYGQAAGSMDNDQTLNWIKGKFFMSVKAVIGGTCAQQQKSLMNLGGMTMEIQAAILAHAPNLDEIGVKITDLGSFNINFSAEELATPPRGQQGARRGQARRRPSPGTWPRPSRSRSTSSSARTPVTSSSSPATSTTTPPARP